MEEGAKKVGAKMGEEAKKVGAKMGEEAKKVGAKLSLWGGEALSKLSLFTKKVRLGCTFRTAVALVNVPVSLRVVL